MPAIIINGTSHPFQSGERLSDILARLGLMGMPCGGHGLCGKCKVQATGALSPVSDAERARLSEQELAAGVRMACCTAALGDCAVTLSTRAAGPIRIEGAQQQVELAPGFSAYGAAVDIGTTTLAAVLYNAAGVRLAAASALNPQGSFGADVITRIGAALAGSGPALAAAVRAAIDSLLVRMAAEAGIDSAAIDGLVLTGNTAMLHLLTGTDPEPLSHAPFAAKRLFDESLTAATLGLAAPAATAQVYLPPCIAAFVGADTVCALLAGGLCQTAGPALLADIGTNGEIALWQSDSLSCCSTAAGPALEGAGISMGMPGGPGAVDHVKVADGQLAAHVIGEGEAVGICGSGVVDAIACLLETEQLDETGCLEDDPTPICGAVSLTGKDVRMVQLAKSAIHAGIRTLLATAKLPVEQLHTLQIAGGFGSYLDVKNAGAIGLLPAELTDRVQVLGNAALGGAVMLLLNTALRANAAALAKNACTVDLAANPVFANEYMERMFF